MSGTASARLDTIPRYSAPVRGLYGRVFEYRRRLQVAIDLVVQFVAFVAAGYLRVDFNFVDFSPVSFLLLAMLASALQLGVGSALGLYRGRHPYASHAEALTLGLVTMAIAVAVTGVNLAFGRVTPVSTTVLGPALALLLMFFVRSAWRAAYESWHRPSSADAAPIVVYGAGGGGQRIVEMLLNDPQSPFIPVGLVDDDPTLAQLRVRGVRVLGGGADLAEIASRTGVEKILLAMPSASPADLRRATDRAVSAGLMVHLLPGMSQMFDGVSTVEDIRPVTESDLLGRGSIDTDIASISDYLKDRRVLVTGAGGSIGSELCRQIQRFAPAQLIMVDRDESALHAVQLSIDGRGQLDTRNLVVCDIRDEQALDLVFGEHRPEVVFHAAALKHVPLLEMYPAEGFKTNVLGSRNLLALATKYGVDRFVNISTDKAADPENVLGYTKRLAERLCAAYARETDGTFLSVRFGNVLGSRGSVLTAFRSQIEAGGPVTVTHPDVTRYFMTVEEAVQLVIQAGAVGRDGEALILDMGEPIRIADVANRLVAAAGTSIDIVYTGLRPGEKMHEVLIGVGEVDERPAHPLVSHVGVSPLSNGVLEAALVRPSVDLADVATWVELVDTEVSVWL